MHQIRFDDLDKLKDLLSQVELFNEFSRYDLPKVAELCKDIQYYNEEERIINKGELDESFFILLAGSARVCKEIAGESLFTLEPGFIFGEISFLSNTERTKYIIANETSFALRITRKMLESLDAGMRERIKDYLIQKLVKRIVKIEADS